MRGNRLLTAVTLLVLAACTQTPKPAPVSAPVPAAPAPPPVVQAPAVPAMDPAAFVQAQANLRALGYNPGKAGDAADPAFQRALISFQKDQGLDQDGVLSPQVMEKLRAMRAALRTSPSAAPAVFVYSGGLFNHQANHQALTLATPPEGFASDAAANFLMPLRAGSQAVLHLTGQDSAPITVTCRTGKVAGSNLPLGKIETLAVDCRGEAADDPQWHDLFSPRLGVVVQRRSKSGTRELIAMRPVTSGWPLAARAGLDWALSHALDDQAAKSMLQWSSTGVAPHFDIKVSARIKGGEAGLGKAYIAASCRRFELVQTGAKASYPGIACLNSAGDWVLPGSDITIARPAGHAGHIPALRSAAK
jgi:hypothetical protein